MQKTNIEYLTHTWNPIAMRCTPVSSGCDNCWHLRMSNRVAGVFLGCNDDYKLYSAYSGENVILRQDELSAPLHRKKPSVIGVQFMGDLFHEKVENEQIAAVFGVMAACHQHTFAVLTKRPERALKWFAYIKEAGAMVPIYIGEDIPEGASGEAAMCVMQNTLEAEQIEPRNFVIGVHQPWPLPNVWLGVSIEDQKTADERIPLLLQIPAAKRFVSAEPLVDKVLLDDGCNSWLTCSCDDEYRVDNCGYCCDSREETGDCFHGIDWVICGAETGPGKRPMNLEWARSLRVQCAAANVPFFFKVDSEGNHTLCRVVHEEMPEGINQCQK